MRLNKFIAQATGLSRRAADEAIQAGRVSINGRPVTLGEKITDSDMVRLDQQILTPSVKLLTIMLNKPPGYVCSRAGQGSKTIYELLPAKFHHLKPVGRLDKDSSGLILLTNDGELANQLTHPRYAKTKIYQVELDKPLTVENRAAIKDGVLLDDGLSRLNLSPMGKGWQVSLDEGRNRQIRRTFAALGHHVTELHRTHFGPYQLKDLASGSYKAIGTENARWSDAG